MNHSMPSFRTFALLLAVPMLLWGNARALATPGDVDGDGIVGPLDLFRMARSFRAAEQDTNFDPATDFDHTGEQSPENLFHFLRHWHREGIPVPDFLMVFERRATVEPAPSVMVLHPVSRVQGLLFPPPAQYPVWDGLQSSLFFIGENETVFRSDLNGSPPVSLGFSVLGSGVRASADGTRIVYSILSGAHQEVWIRDSNGQNPRKLGGGSGQGWILPSFTPTGKVVFTKMAFPGGLQGLWVMDPDSEDPPQQLVSLGNALNGRFSPDETQIAFDDTQSLYVADAVPGATPERIITTNALITFGDWSPDGTHLVYRQSNVPGTGGDGIFMVPAGGGEPISLALGRGQFFHANPDW